MNIPGSPLGAAGGAYLCIPPWHPDNLRDTPQAAKKLYLATGPDLGNAVGAYNSWTSANRVISGSRGATAPWFSNWEDLLVSWQAGCSRGDHGHPSGPDYPRATTASVPTAPATPSRRRTATITIGDRVYEDLPYSVSPSSMRRSGTTPTASASPSQSRGGGSASSTARAPSQSRGSAWREATHSTPFSRVYGVRWNEEGVVLSVLDEAIELFDELDSLGLRPRMLTSCSSVDAACFAEGFSPTLPGSEAQRRRAWIEVQQDAHARSAQERQEGALTEEQEELRALRQRLAQLESKLA
ncbi:hypothetical protein B0H11DRAFT_2233493 [Mycena galericulata]|nr:hypothetical protein B0H11DRAFT_2233493 [Mycena galericulata]